MLLTTADIWFFRSQSGRQRSLDCKVDLDRLLPFATSRERYLAATKPIHPTGNPFVVPVKYHGYYMEAHKDYKNAISHLGSLVAKLGLELKYLG